MVKTEIAICKKGKTGYFDLIVGKEYLYNKIFDMQVFYRVIISDDQDVYLVQDDFDDYFYNIREVRRDKLNKISKQK